MSKFFKIASAFLLFLLSGCDRTKSVGTIECGDIKIDVMSIKNKRNSLNGQTWSKAISFQGVTLQVHNTPYDGHFPESFHREITGTKPLPDFGSHDFPHGSANQFFMGEFPAKDRKQLTQCLVENDKKLRALFLKTKNMKQFPPPGEFNSRFVFWDAKEKDFRLRFEANGENDEYLSLTSTSIFYHKKGKGQFMRVGKLQWDKERKLIGVAVDIKKRKVTPIQTDPTQFKRNEQTLADFFGVPFVHWAPKY